ncbi:hypothetical protein UlMin_024730 [Ulmus minor]
MGLLSNEISKDKVQIGDHIYTYRMMHLYSHHGIYVGNDTVIHYTGADVVGKSESKSRCGKCGHQPSPNLEGLLKTCLNCFLDGHRLFRFEYEVSSTNLVIQHHRTCSTRSCDKPQVVVERAWELLNNGFGNYDLFENNCECFAFYCKTGKPMSLQATFAKSAGKVATKGINLNNGLPNPLRVAKNCVKLVWKPKLEMYIKDKYLANQPHNST